VRHKRKRGKAGRGKIIIKIKIKNTKMGSTYYSRGWYGIYKIHLKKKKELLT